MKNKVLMALLSFVLVTGLIACSSPTTPAPAPAPTTSAPAPATSAPPATSKAPTTSAPAATTTAPSSTAAPKEITNIVMRGGITSGEGYLQAFGLADLFNKNHPWIRGTAMTSPGSADDAYSLAKEAGTRKNTIIWLPDSTAWGIANAAQPYFKEAYGNLRFLLAGYISNLSLLTLKPEIKELKDLVGKKVALYSATGATNLQFVSLFAGMDAVIPAFATKLTPQYLSFDAGHGALRDGLLDAAVASATIPPAGSTKWVPAAWTLESLSRPGAHFVNFPKDVVERGAKAGGFPISYLEVPANGIIEGAAAFGSTAQVISWSADASMSDDLAYEITKFAFDRMKDMTAYSGASKSWTPENRPTWPLGQQNMHPGAIKFYKEKGLLK